MTYDVLFTETAEKEIDDIFLWLVARSTRYAADWVRGLHDGIETLREFPNRCPLARESLLFDSPVRQLLYGKRRILFTLVDSDGDGELDTVRILHVRHGARRDLGEDFDE